VRNSEITLIVKEKKKGKKSKWNPHIFCLFVTNHYKSNFEVMLKNSAVCTSLTVNTYDVHLSAEFCGLPVSTKIKFKYLL